MISVHRPLTASGPIGSQLIVPSPFNQSKATDNAINCAVLSGRGPRFARMEPPFYHSSLPRPALVDILFFSAPTRCERSGHTAFHRCTQSRTTDSILNRLDLPELAGEATCLPIAHPYEDLLEKLRNRISPLLLTHGSPSLQRMAMYRFHHGP